VDKVAFAALDIKKGHPPKRAPWVPSWSRSADRIRMYPSTKRGTQWESWL